MAIHIFISSVQREFAEERKMFATYVRQDEAPGKFFRVFLFEKSPVQFNPARQVYLEQGKHCDIYLKIFGKEHGNTDAEGVSAAEREYDKTESALLTYYSTRSSSALQIRRGAK